MAFFPQHVVRDRGGAIFTDLPRRPTAAPAPTVTVRGPDGTLYANAVAATIDPVSTTLGVAAAAGATSITLAIAAAPVIGRAYLLGRTGDTAPSELVRIRSGTDLVWTLAQPLRFAHAITAGFEGVRLSLAVTAAQASALFFDGHAEWLWSSDGATLNEQSLSAVECVRLAHRRLATWQDVVAIDPKAAQTIDDELVIDELLDESYSDVLAELGARFRVRTTIPNEAFVRATAWRAAWRMAMLYGEAFDYLRTIYRDEYDREVARLTAHAAVDADQDGYIDREERGGGFTSIRVDRA